MTLGLSYIFFRVLHLLIDCGEGNEKRYVGFGAYLLYTLNFTTLVAGPIQRYDEFERDQFAAEPIGLGVRVVGLQLERIIRGFFKVNVMAMLFDMARADALTDLLHAGPAPMKFYAALRLVVAYPLFLYANFSGYIDIVIALARLMRVRLPENFDRPFEASSVLDFWNRWHITLSNWLKTYVYNPLLLTLMRRVSSQGAQQLLGVLCFFVTFFLIGVWHGRTSEFVFFGILTGAGMAINKLWQLGLTWALGRKKYRALASDFFYRAFGRAEFCLVCIYAALVLGAMGGTRAGVRGIEHGPVGCGLADRLALRDRDIGVLGVVKERPALDQGWRRSGVDKPLCACDVCVGAGVGSICGDGIAQIDQPRDCLTGPSGGCSGGA